MGILLLSAVVLSACGSGTESWPGIAGKTDTNTVIMSFDKTVTSLNADKSRNWIYEYKGARFYAPALITDEYTFVGDYNGRLHAIETETGKGVWVYEPERTSILFIDFGANDRIIAPATFGNDTVFFGTEQGLFAITANGDEPRILWEYTDFSHSIWAQPVYVDNPELNIPPTLFVAALDKHVYAFDPVTGELRWQVKLNGAIPGRPTLDETNRVLYAGTLNSRLYALSLTGEIVAEYQTEGWLWNAPVIHTVDETTNLYVGDLEGWMYGLQLTDDGFEVLWKNHLSEEAIRAQPVIVEDVLVVGSEDKNLYAVNLNDQSSKWVNSSIEEKILTQLTVLEDENGDPLIVLGTENKDRAVIAVRLNDGKPAWEYKYEQKD
jgi:outer membrane protein assembly factor BamB